VTWTEGKASVADLHLGFAGIITKHAIKKVYLEDSTKVEIL
jgi:hypothetical protein